MEQNRQAESKIVQRDLSLLSMLDKSDREIIKRVHGLPPYKKQQILPAVGSCGKKPHTYYYYYALGRLIKIQARQPESEKWLPEKYNAAEKVQNKLLGFDRQGASRIAMHQKWELLFAQYYFNLDRKAYGIKKNTKYSAFRNGIKFFLEGQVRHCDWNKQFPGIYASIVRNIGVSNYRFLQDLYMDYWLDSRQIPAELVKKKIPRGNLENIISELGGYEKIRQEWKSVFEETKPSDYALAVMRAVRSKVPADIILTTRSTITLEAISRLFTSHPAKRTQLNFIFSKASPRRLYEMCCILTRPAYQMPKTSGIVPDFEDALKYCAKQAELEECRVKQ
jgi:hypothetical protein